MSTTIPPDAPSKVILPQPPDIPWGTVLGVAFPTLFVIAVLALALASDTAGIMRDATQGVVFRLGKRRPKPIPPGPYFRIPGINRVVIVETKTEDVELPLQTITFEDNSQIGISLRVEFHVVDASAAYQLEDFRASALNAVQAAAGELLTGQPRAAISGSSLEEINNRIYDTAARRLWDRGIKLDSAAIISTEFPEELRVAMNRRAAALADAEAEEIWAKNQKTLGPIYREAAKAFFAEGTHPTEEQITEMAVRLFEGQTIQESGGGSVVNMASRRTGQPLPPPSRPASA